MGERFKIQRLFVTIKSTNQKLFKRWLSNEWLIRQRLSKLNPLIETEHLLVSLFTQMVAKPIYWSGVNRTPPLEKKVSKANESFDPLVAVLPKCHTERWAPGVICELQMHQLVSREILTFERCCKVKKDGYISDW